MLVTDSWSEIGLRLGVATFIGLLLGLDRELRGHDAGLRTNALVALSSAMVTLSSLLLFDTLKHLNSQPDPLRVIQGVAQAIGFIAAGLIFVKRGDVRNITTAANLWVSACAGIVSGLGQYKLLAVGTTLALLLLVSEYLFKRLIPNYHQPDEDDGDASQPQGAVHRNTTKYDDPKA
jgi:putative Mg2+ transporter-C (MgtC) family protein